MNTTKNLAVRFSYNHAEVRCERPDGSRYVSDLQYEALLWGHNLWRPSIMRLRRSIAYHLMVDVSKVRVFIRFKWIKPEDITDSIRPCCVEQPA